MASAAGGQTVKEGFKKIAYARCVFDGGGSGFVFQGQAIPDMTFTNCTVKRGNLFSGTAGPCPGLKVTDCTIAPGAKSVGSFDGKAAPLWVNTTGATVGTKVDAYQPSNKTMAVAPVNELAWLNDANAIPGGVSVIMDPKARLYPVGFKTRLYASKPGQWTLKADPAKNTWPANVPVTPNGVNVRINKDLKWELVK
jgi:hypothetical protein